MKKSLTSLVLVALVASLLLAAGATAGVRTGRANPGAPPVFSAAEVAPVEACPNQTSLGLSAEEGAAAMLCMTNYARAANGLAALRPNRQLGRAAAEKSGDILGCGEFSHEACGRTFYFWAQRFGYLRGCWKVAENIAWGTGSYATVRGTFTAWLESTDHHENILGPYREVGIGLRVGRLEGHEGAAVWTQDFGSHQC
ncbi:MAG TPA: CAP domain-containing protein [Solirubrobacterales bacterium]|nr:CAP domain-containing protein [Solirubrobacterales bacterium]